MCSWWLNVSLAEHFLGNISLRRMDWIQGCRLLWAPTKQSIEYLTGSLDPTFVYIIKVHSFLLCPSRKYSFTQGKINTGAFENMQIWKSIKNQLLRELTFPSPSASASRIISSISSSLSISPRVDITFLSSSLEMNLEIKDYLFYLFNTLLWRILNIFIYVGC